MSTMATPRVPPTETPRSNTNQSRLSLTSLASHHSEPKKKGNEGGTARGGSETTRLSSSIIAEEGELVQAEEEKEAEADVNLPFFRQDPYTDVVLQVFLFYVFTFCYILWTSSVDDKLINIVLLIFSR